MWRGWIPSPMRPRSHGRKLALVGRSMHKIVAGGARHRLSQGFSRRAGRGGSRANLPRRARCFICVTGSQGEPRAALARIAEDNHPDVQSGQGRRGDLFLPHHSRQRTRRSSSCTTSSRALGVEVLTERGSFRPCLRPSRARGTGRRCIAGPGRASPCRCMANCATWPNMPGWPNRCRCPRRWCPPMASFTAWRPAPPN